MNSQNVSYLSERLATSMVSRFIPFSSEKRGSPGLLHCILFFFGCIKLLCCNFFCSGLVWNDPFLNLLGCTTKSGQEWIHAKNLPGSYNPVMQRINNVKHIGLPKRHLISFLWIIIVEMGPEKINHSIVIHTNAKWEFPKIFSKCIMRKNLLDVKRVSALERNDLIIFIPTILRN